VQVTAVVLVGAGLGQLAGLLVAACCTVPTVGLSEGDGPSSFEQALAINRKRNTTYQALGDGD
jgi:hypothetical protein